MIELLLRILFGCTWLGHGRPVLTLAAADAPAQVFRCEFCDTPLVYLGCDHRPSLATSAMKLLSNFKSVRSD